MKRHINYHNLCRGVQLLSVVAATQLLQSCILIKGYFSIIFAFWGLSLAILIIVGVLLFIIDIRTKAQQEKFERTYLNDPGGQMQTYGGTEIKAYYWPAHHRLTIGAFDTGGHQSKDIEDFDVTLDLTSSTDDRRLYLVDATRQKLLIAAGLGSELKRLELVDAGPCAPDDEWVVQQKRKRVLALNRTRGYVLMICEGVCKRLTLPPSQSTDLWNLTADGDDATLMNLTRGYLYGIGDGEPVHYAIPAVNSEDDVKIWNFGDNYILLLCPMGFLFTINKGKVSILGSFGPLAESFQLSQLAAEIRPDGKRTGNDWYETLLFDEQQTAVFIDKKSNESLAVPYAQMRMGADFHEEFRTVQHKDLVKSEWKGRGLIYEFVSGDDTKHRVDTYNVYETTESEGISDLRFKISDYRTNRTIVSYLLSLSTIDNHTDSGRKKVKRKEDEAREAIRPLTSRIDQAVAAAAIPRGTAGE
ncbi:MAG: hypothetical protein IJ710_06165 [Prevotella sp.]|nr:hypothetical protein [Prevotella sp.]